MGWDGLERAEEGDFGGVAGEVGLGGLEDHGEGAEEGMTDDGAEGGKSEVAVADGLVAVLMRAERILGVVDVEGAEPGESDDAVELGEDVVEGGGDGVSGVVDVAGVEGDEEVFGVFHAVDDGAEVRELAADFGALAGHGLQQDGGGGERGQHDVEQGDDVPDAGLHALSDMGAGMEVVEAAGDGLDAGEVVEEGVEGEPPDLGLGRGGIEGVWGVGDGRSEMRLGGEAAVLFEVGGIHGPGLSAARIAGEELEGVGVDANRVAREGGKAVGDGQMRADVEHGGGGIVRL